MAIEDELRAGLISRAEALLGAASTCLYLAFTPPTDPTTWLTGVQQAQRNLKYAEAVEAAVLTRSGPSWDVLASRLNQTRQALHRRLGTDADRLMEAARETESMTTEQLLRWKDLLASWAKSEEMAKTPSDLYGEMAAQLARLRRQQHWWRDPGLIR